MSNDVSHHATLQSLEIFSKAVFEKIDVDEKVLMRQLAQCCMDPYMELAATELDCWPITPKPLKADG